MKKTFMIFAILFFCQHAIVFVYDGKYYIIGIFYFVTLDTYASIYLVIQIFRS